MKQSLRPYKDQRVALLTQHGKEAILAPILGAALGCRVERVTGFDTDSLGTFTREIPRPGSQQDAALRKARIGMEMAGLPLGVASEGAVGGDSLTGLLPWGVELVIFVDDIRAITVTGRAEGLARCVQRQATDWEQVQSLAGEGGFPDHHLVVRPDHGLHPLVRKGLRDWESLRAAFLWASGLSPHGTVFVESDLRAHANPTRCRLIEAAAHDLAGRLASACPQCGVPGYGIHAAVPGLVCDACGRPTRLARAHRWRCVSCDHEEVLPCPEATAADPRSCDTCNP